LGQNRMLRLRHCDCPLVAHDHILCVTAPAILHPISRTTIGFYSLTTAYEASEWAGRLASNISRTETRADMLAQSVAMLRYTVSALGPAHILAYTPDFSTFQIAKAAYLLAKVNFALEVVDDLGIADRILNRLEIAGDE
jgi:hypothetical protein